MDFRSILTMTCVTSLVSSVPTFLKHVYDNSGISCSSIRRKVTSQKIYTGIIKDTVIYSYGRITMTSDNHNKKELRVAIIEYLTDNNIICEDFDINISDDGITKESKNNYGMYHVQQKKIDAKNDDLTAYDRIMKLDV